MDWALFLILSIVCQPSLSVLFTVEAELNAYKSEFGGDVVMGCRFQPKPMDPGAYLNVAWHWIKPGGDRVVYRKYNGEEKPASAGYQGRVTLLTEELGKGWAKIKISKLRISDSGTYQCLVQTTDGADYKTIALSVVAPYKSVTKRIEWTAEGSDLLLTCQSEGFPVSSVVWQDGRLQELRPNTTTEPTAEQLIKVTSQIRVSARDKNNYTCQFANDGHSATFQVPVEVESPALLIVMATGAVVAAVVVVLLMYRRKKRDRNFRGDHWCWPSPAACRQIQDEERNFFHGSCAEENLGARLKAHYSEELRGLWDAAEQQPRRLQNSEGQLMKLQDLLPKAGETLFLQEPPESEKTTVAQILVSSWTQGRTDLLDLRPLRLLVYVDGSAAEDDLFKEILTQRCLTNTWSEDELRAALTRGGEALLLLDGYREGKKTFDESLKRFLSERGGCRVLVTASPESCVSLREACGTGEMLRLETDNCLIAVS